MPTEVDPELRSKAREQEAKTTQTPATASRRRKTNRVAIFVRKDTDKDRKLTRKEFLHRFPDPEEGKRRFTSFDTNGDGTLSHKEFVTPSKNRAR